MHTSLIREPQRHGYYFRWKLITTALPAERTSNLWHVLFDDQVDHSYDATWLAAIHVLKNGKTHSHHPSQGAPFSTSVKLQWANCSCPLAHCACGPLRRTLYTCGQPSGRAIGETDWMHLQPALPLCVVHFARLLGCLCVVPIATGFLRS